MANKSGKRVKSGTLLAHGAKWESALLSTHFEEETWKPNVTVVVPNRIEDLKLIDMFTTVVNSKVRKLFTVVTFESLLAEVRELGNPKSKKSKEVPAFSEVCEPCKQFLDSGEEIPLPLLAKLIKYRLLAIKSIDMKRIEALKKDKGKKDINSRATPIKKGGKKTPEPPQAKDGSKLKKRGEENSEVKFIDDEPEDGANFYILLQGFHNPHLFSFLSEVGVHVHSIIRVVSQDYSRIIPPPSEPGIFEKDEKTLAAEEAARIEKRKQSHNIFTFWKDILHLLRNNQDSSKLHDIARLDYEVKALLLPVNFDDPEQRMQFGLAIFEDIATMIYDLHDARRLYYTYLQNLKLIEVPLLTLLPQEKIVGGAEGQSGGASSTPGGQLPPISSGSVIMDANIPESTNAPDLRYYNDMMRNIPQESTSVALILHCMLEQVVATEENREPFSEQPPAPRQDNLHIAMADYLSSIAFKLALSEDEYKSLSEVIDLPQRPPEEPRPPLLMNMHDGISIRTHHLSPVNGFQLEDVERSMLHLHSFAKHCQTIRPTSAVARARAARLQELIQFCAINGLVPSEIDRAFKQFVFECMDFAITDTNGFIITREYEGVEHSVIPWDDPYPFFKGMIPKKEDTKSKICVAEYLVEGSSDSENEFSRLSTPSPPVGSDYATYMLSQEHGDTQHDKQSKHIERLLPNHTPKGKKQSLRQGISLQENEINEIKTPESYPLDKKGHHSKRSLQALSAESTKSILRSRSQSLSPNSSPRRSFSGSVVHFDVPADHKYEQELQSDELLRRMEEEVEDKTINESMMEVSGAQKRVLDQWCFAEHYEPHVLLQVLQEALYQLPFVETYHHKRDQSLLIVLHNPFNIELQNHIDWHTEMHSNVGFRNYLENMAELIADWLKEKEAEYQAHLLSAEVEKMLRQDEADAKAEETKKAKEKSPHRASSRSKSPKSSRPSTSDSTSSLKKYVRANSLKAMIEEQEKSLVDEEEKSAQKGPRSRATNKKEDKKQKNERNISSAKAKSPPKEEAQAVGGGTLPVKENKEPYWPFTGYDTGNLLLHASGITSTLFPSDGGQIRMERTEFVQGTTSVRVTLLKDGHVFAVHVLNPKDSLEEEIDPFMDTPSSVVKSEDTEKSDNEKSEKGEKQPFLVLSKFPGSLVKDCYDCGRCERCLPQCISVRNTLLSIDKWWQESRSDSGSKKVTAVSQFGSITASLSDGMVLSFSQWGPTGETEEGKPYKPAAYVLPVRSQTPQPQAPTRAGIPSAKGKREKMSKLQEMVAIPVEEEVQEILEEKKVPEQPFQEVSVTTPDGLHVKYFLMSAIGVVPTSAEDRHLAVRQSYPFKTSGSQECESKRQKHIMNEVSRVITAEGTVVKSMVDGSVEVLYADGMVAVHNGTWAPGGSRCSSPIRPSSAVIPVEDRAGQESPSKKDKAPTSARKTGPRGGVDRGGVDKPTEQISLALPDSTELKKGAWTVTYPNGERMKFVSDGNSEDMKPVMICVATDPDTKQSMSTRDDKVITVSYPDGTTVVEHSDGTRITEYYRDTVATSDEKEENEEADTYMQTLKFVKVECPAYATVEFNCATSENLTVFGSGTSINVFPDGFYILHHARGGRIELDTESTLVYYPRVNTSMEHLLPERELQYFLRHNADVICETVDPEGNAFKVRYTGDFNVQSAQIRDEMSDSLSEELHSNDGHKVLTTYGQHAPRFFIVHADGSGTELLRYKDLSEYLLLAERNPATAILKEPLPDYPGVNGITILKPYIGGLSEQWFKNYDQESIVPSGIRSRDLTTLQPRQFEKPGPRFGSKVGQGLCVGTAVKSQPRMPILKCPAALELRQLVQYKPVSEALRRNLRRGLHDYAEMVMERNQAQILMAVTDPRSEEERTLAADILDTAIARCPQPSPIEPDFVKALYEEAIAPPPPSPPPSPMPKRTQADWERDNRELAEEVEGRNVLRGKTIPSYFESELGKAFLLTQAKDMDELLKQLSEDPRRDGREAIRADTSSHSNSTGDIGSSPAFTRQMQSRPGMSVMSDRSAVTGDSPATLTRKQVPETPISNGGTLGELVAATPSGSIRPGNPTPAHAAGQGSPAPLRPKNPTPAKASKVVADRPVNPTPHVAGGHTDTPSGFEMSQTRWEYPMILEQPMEEERVPEILENDKDFTTTASLKINVAGEPRSLPVPLPASIKGGRPGAELNTRYQTIEDPVRRHIKNTVAAGVTIQGAIMLRQMQGLILLPEEVNFGILKEGCTYAFLVQMKNTGVDSCRFKVRQPPPATGLRVLYKPGAVAAGMKTELRLELYAIAVGVEGEAGVGTISHDLEIVTETNILRLPIVATVMTAYEFDNRADDTFRAGPTPGVILVSSKPPASTGIIRPRRDLAVGEAAR